MFLNIIIPIETLTTTIIISLLVCSGNIVIISDSLFKINSGTKIAITIFLWELCLLVIAQSELLSLRLNTKINVFSSFLIIIILVISFVLLYMLITNNIRKNYYMHLNSNLEARIQEQLTHYQHLNDVYKNLRHFKHDYDNLRIGLQSFLSAGDIIGAETFLNQCNNLIDNEYTLKYTGHPIVNALITEKLYSVKNHYIKIQFTGIIPLNFLTSTDICIIFGNALDNAIESCLKISNKKDRIITIEVSQKQNVLFISISNPTDKEVIINKNSIVSTKEVLDDHGLGLYSIKNVVKKYNGYIHLNYSNHTFVLDLAFNL